MSDVPICAYRLRGRRCSRPLGHDGDCILAPDPDATVIVEDDSVLLTPRWQRALRRLWRKLVRAVR